MSCWAEPPTTAATPEFVRALLQQREGNRDPYTFGSGDNTVTLKGQGFVDDILLLSSTHKGLTARAEALADFMVAHGMTINSKKSFHVVCTPNPTQNPSPPRGLM